MITDHPEVSPLTEKHVNGEESFVTFTLSIKGMKKRIFEHSNGSEEYSPTLKKPKQSTISDVGDQSVQQLSNLTLENQHVETISVPSDLNGNKKKKETQQTTHQQVSNQSSSSQEESIVQVKIPEHEWKRTIERYVETTMQPTNSAIRDLTENVKETKRSFWLISTPLWMLVLLVSILIGIEYSKFHSTNQGSSNNAPPKFVYINSTQPNVLPKYKPPVTIKEIKKSPEIKVDVPTPIKVKKIKIQYLSVNVDYMNNEYLEEKLRNLTSIKGVRVEFHQIRSISELSTDSFFLLVIQSRRFNEEERDSVKEQYLEHLNAKRSSVILICNASMIRFNRDVLGVDVFSVKWYENANDRQVEDEKTIGGLIGTFMND